MDARNGLRVLVLIWLALFAAGLDFEPPYFRPFELIRTDGPAFLPDRQVEMDAYGALSYRLVVPEVRVVRHNVFTTDAAGFRNPPMAPPQVIVIGDSFVVGVGLSDEQTFPRALQRALGVPVYNYGAQGSEGPPYFLADRRFGRAPEVLLFMPSEATLGELRMPGSEPAATEPAAPRRLPVPPLFAGLDAWGARLVDLNMVVNRDNGLRQVARRYFQAARRALTGDPNRIMVQGAPALVMTLDEQLRTEVVDDARFERILAAYLRFDEIARQRGGRLVVAPIPGTGSVYEALFPEADRRRAVHPSLLQRLQEELRERGVEVIVLLALFEAHRSPYLYLRDDTHWDAHAVELAAGHVAEALRRRGLVTAQKL